MISSIGKNIIVSIWGGSHEPTVGVDITGIPIGTKINMEDLRSFLRRRAPKGTKLTTGRKEDDIPVAEDGLITVGKDFPEILKVVSKKISFGIVNSDVYSADYIKMRSVPRPGHADFTARLRYGNKLNMAGGGPFSARMTAPLCIAGGIALQILSEGGTKIGGHIKSIGDVKDTSFDPVNIPMELLQSLGKKDLAVISDEAGEKMKRAILSVADEGDSLGGIIEVCAVDPPAGIGGAMYYGLESGVAPIFFGIPAVKGVEFGAGFSAAGMKGSHNNDAFYYEGNKIKTVTNNHGGILGGITTGMPVIARVAFKPTPSILIKQNSVNLDTGENSELIIKGRHDPCVAVRAVPIVEAALALGILDCVMEVKNEGNKR